MIVSQTWTHALPLQQQAVLFLACRGCDGRPKHHGAKWITRRIRGFVMNAAKFGGPLDLDTEVDTFMSTRVFGDEARVALAAFEESVDDLPLHFFQHVACAAGVLRKHPVPAVAHFWTHFYEHCAHYMHMTPETIEQMDARLNDWGQKYWEPCA